MGGGLVAVRVCGCILVECGCGLGGCVGWVLVEVTNWSYGRCKCAKTVESWSYPKKLVRYS